mgnify:CR=1 FL=1
MLINQLKFQIFNLIFFSGLISYLLIIPIRYFCKKYKIFDKPNSRKLHKKEVPNIGGIAIYISFFLSFILFIQVSDLQLENFITYSIISFIVFFIGLIDDIYNLSAFKRLIIQIGLSIFMWSKGIGIKYLTLDFINSGINNIELPISLSIFITSIWIVGVMNAINWVDGLNGLASGVVSIIFLVISIIAMIKGMTLLSIICFCLIGSCQGFLIHNLKPNFIIMGDSGSNFLGFNLSILSLYVASNSDIFQTNFSILPFIPLLLLGFPIIDMTAVIIKRIKNRQSPFSPDKNHLHHKLINSGLSIFEINILIYSITFFISSFSFLFVEF